MPKLLTFAVFSVLALFLHGCIEEETSSINGANQAITMSDSEFLSRATQLGATLDPLTPQQSSIVSRGSDSEVFYQDCDDSACWCVGGSDCLDMITSNDCEYLRCNSSPQGPV
ncbi:MAG: hypothetical protein AAFX89_08695, partial [Pseudomonadota bacterium]